MPQNTKPEHLTILSNAGLISGERQSRSIIYRADLESFRSVMLYLLKDCCGGNVRLCAPLIAGLTPCYPPRSPSNSKLNHENHAMTRVYNGLFLCTGSSARSILAEAILQAEEKGSFRSFSADSQPKGEVHTMALKTLAALGYPHDGFRSRAGTSLHFQVRRSSISSSPSATMPLAKHVRSYLAIR